MRRHTMHPQIVEQLEKLKPLIKNYVRAVLLFAKEERVRSFYDCRSLLFAAADLVTSQNPFAQEKDILNTAIHFRILIPSLKKLYNFASEPALQILDLSNQQVSAAINTLYMDLLEAKKIPVKQLSFRPNPTLALAEQLEQALLTSCEVIKAVPSEEPMRPFANTCHT
jgi:hypothetical protein